MQRTVRSLSPLQVVQGLGRVQLRRGLLTQSLTRGPTEPPLSNETVGENFRQIVSHYGDREAVVSSHQQQRLTFEELDQTSDALAQGLRERGVKCGDRVAVSLGNNIEHAIAIYGVFKLGAVLVPLNPSFNAQQVISALLHLQASHLIIGTETSVSGKEPRENISLLRQIVPNLERSNVESPVVPSLKDVILVDNSHGRLSAALPPFRTFARILADSRSTKSLVLPALSSQDVINIQFTSGTTSAPKAACLTHCNILNNGISIGNRMRLTPSDVICCPPPLFHCFGSVLGYMASVTHASCIVFPSEAFDAKATLRAVQKERCTALYGVPTMFISELELLESGQIKHEGFEHLRTGIGAGSSVPAELMRKLHRTLNLTELCICYGMTETSPVSAMTTTDDPIERRISSVGRPLPHVECKIVDPLNRTRILPTGQRGELATAGYLVMKDYWNDPKRTTEVMIPDDTGKIWMHTGDEAVIDEEGYVTITGRIKDIIIRGGENIHPLEVENCMLAHPAVRDVAVVGLPDKKYGEVIAAFVVKRRVADLARLDLQQWVKNRLSHHLVPKYIFWTDNYPKTASGKIQKFKLREEGVRLVDAGEGLT